MLWLNRLMAQLRTIQVILQRIQLRTVQRIVQRTQQKIQLSN